MIRVAILRGGTSNEYDVSLKSGDMILRHLDRERFEPVDVLIDRTGIWHHKGLPIEPHILHRHVDIVLNALHGGVGEDGGVQQLLEQHGFLYTGSGPLASSIGMHKRQTKVLARDAGLETPNDILIPDYRTQSALSRQEYIEEAVQFIFKTIPPPWVVKPLKGGSSLGVFLPRTYAELLSALNELSKNGGDILVEEHVRGREATVTVVDHFRDEPLYAFLPIEIKVPTGNFFDYDHKYSGKAEEISPGRFSQEVSEALQQAAKKIHQQIGARHYSRSDFIVTPKGIHFLEINTLPGLTEESLVPKSFAPVGTSMKEFLSHILDLALGKK